jgi:hypothetical protein
MSARVSVSGSGRGNARHVVGLQDALDAVIQLAAVIDEAIPDGRLPPARGQHAAAMLMFVRGYIQPLPQDLDADGVTGNVTTDLGSMVMALCEACQATGYKG